MFCPKCKKEVTDGARFCVECGHPLPASDSNYASVGDHEKADVGALSMQQIVGDQKPQQTAALTPRPTVDEMYCFSCGSVIKKIAEICPKCGVKQNTVLYSQNTLTERKSRAIVIPALVLIGIGAIFILIQLSYGISSSSLYRGPYGFFNSPLYNRIAGFGLTRLYMRLSYILNIPAAISFSFGAVLAVISLYKFRNKMALILCFVSIGLPALINIIILLLRIFILVSSGR